MAASTQALIDAFAAGSPPFLLPPTSPVYDQAPLGHRAAMIHRRDDMTPRWSSKYSVRLRMIVRLSY
ncbi:hypothetical protein Tco_0243926 [Tanacetum coccineum]